MTINSIITIHKNTDTGTNFLLPIECEYDYTLSDGLKGHCNELFETVNSAKRFYIKHFGNGVKLVLKGV